jgi:DNA-binding NtrC family response regulator
MTLLNRIKIFIVEDDAVQAQILKDRLMEMVSPSSIECFDNSDSLFDYINKGLSSNRTNYLIVDYFLQTENHPDSLNGLDIIKIVSQQHPNIKTILFSAFEADDSNSFQKIKEQCKLLDFVKKGEHGYSSLINIIRFNYSQINLNRRKKRLRWALYLTITIVLIVLAQLIYFSF